MGLANCRTTFFVQNVIMMTSTKLQKFKIRTCSDLSLGHQYLCKKWNKHNHKEYNNYLQTKGRTFTKIITIVQFIN